MNSSKITLNNSTGIFTKPNSHIREYSTNDKYQQLQNSSRKVQQLTYENNLLKEHLKNLGYDYFTNSNRSSSPKKYVTGQFNDTNQYIQEQDDTHWIQRWQMGTRNQYLASKVKRLKKQHSSIRQKINHIKQTQQWKNRAECNYNNCFYKRHIKLLRFQSPSVDF